MSDDDDDESAGSVEEPEMDVQAARDVARASRDDDDELDGVVDFRGGGGSPDNASVVRRGRVISDKTRDLFKKASEQIKQQLGSDDDDDEHFGEVDEPATPTPDTLATTAGSTKPQGGAPVPGSETSPVVVPAPSLDPKVQDRIRELEGRSAELDAREAKLAAREQASDISRVRDEYYERGAVAIRDMVKSFTPDVSDDQFREEIADLITDLTANVLGVEVPAEVQNALRSKRALKSVEAYKAKAKADVEAQKKANEAAQQQERERQAAATLDQEFTKTDQPYSKSFPFLAAEESPGDIVIDVIRAHRDKHGEVLQWTEAAKRANEYLEKNARRYFDRRRHLLTAASEGVATGQPKDRPQGDPSGIRRSQTISNAAAATPQPNAPTPTDKPVVQNGKWSRDAHRANTRRKFREAFKSSDE